MTRLERLRTAIRVGWTILSGQANPVGLCLDVRGDVVPRTELVGDWEINRPVWRTEITVESSDAINAALVLAGGKVVPIDLYPDVYLFAVRL